MNGSVSIIFNMYNINSYFGGGSVKILEGQAQIWTKGLISSQLFQTHHSLFCRQAADVSA